MTQEQNRDKPASGQGQSEKFRGHKPSKANFIPLGVDVLDCPDLDFLDAATLVFVSGRI